MNDPKYLKPRLNAAIESGDFKVNIPQPMTDRERYEKQQYRSQDNGQRFIKYYVETKIYYQSYKVSSECADILFINTGTQNVFVNDVLLIPQQTLRITAQYMEIDTTIYYVRFANSSNTGNAITVLRKLYV